MNLSQNLLRCPSLQLLIQGTDSSSNMWTFNNSEEISFPSPELSYDRGPPELNSDTDGESQYDDINLEPEGDEPEDCLDDSKRRNYVLHYIQYIYKKDTF